MIFTPLQKVRSSHPVYFLVLGIFVCICILGSAAFSFFNDAYAAINKQINYQGKLTNSSNVAVSNGTYNMEFKLYTVSSGGSPVWTETRTSGDKVQVTNGLFSVLLGEVTSLDSVDFNQTLYLGVNIGGTSTPAWDGEMTPRKKIGAVPAAMVAETLNGLYSHQFLRTDVTNATNTSSAFLKVQQSGAGAVAQFIGTGTSTAMIIQSDGKVAVGTSTASTTLDVWGGLRVGTSTNGAVLYVNSATQKVGIGTINPTSALSVSGDIAATSVITAPYFSASSNTSTSTFAGIVEFGSTAMAYENDAAVALFNNQKSVGFFAKTDFAGGTVIYGRSDAASSTGVSGVGTDYGVRGYGRYGVHGTSEVSGGAAGYFIADGADYSIYATGAKSVFTSNVGIGTTTPDFLLTVAGDINVTGALRASGDAGSNGYVLQTTGSGIQWVATSSLGISGGGGSGTVNSGTAGQIAFYNANGTAVSGTSTLFINSEKLGVGTTTPGVKLDIWGDFRIATGSTPLFYASTTLNRIAIGTTTTSTLLNVGGTSTIQTLIAGRYTDNYRSLTLSQLYRNPSYAKFTQYNTRYATTTPHTPGNYYLATSTTSFAGAASLADISGVKYYGKNNTLLFNRNTNGTQRIYEFTLDGQLLRTITLSGFPDPEALDWMYDDWFVIGDENTISADTGSKITIIQIPDGTTSISRSSGTVIDLSGTIPIDNQGIEGVAYDPHRDVFYVAEEGAGTDTNIYRVTRSGTVSTIWNPDTTTMSNLNVGDISDLYYDPNTDHLFLAVDQCYNQANGLAGCDKVVEIDLNGNVIDQIHAPNGFNQIEGVGFSPDGESLFMAGEPSMFAWYKFQNRSDKLFAYQFSSSTPLTLGIGTTTPLSTLTVQGSGSVNPFLVASSSGAALLTVLHSGNTGIGSSTPYAKLSVTGTSGSTNDLFIVASSSNSQFLTIKSTGAVGIGTSSPVARLGIETSDAIGSATYISGSTATDKFAGIFSNTSTAIGDNVYGLYVQSSNTNDPTSVYGVYANAIGNSSIGVFANGNTGISTQGTIALFATSTSASGYAAYLTQGNTNGFSLYALGGKNYFQRSVGIGTTTPSAVLAITGTAGSGDIVNIASSTNSSLFKISSTGALYLNNTAGNSGYVLQSQGTTGAPIWSAPQLTTGNGFVATATSTDSIRAAFFTATSTTATSTFGAAVAVGTSSTQAMLSVYGNALLEGVNRYLNFGTDSGTNGYGFRDNGGTLEYKNSGGSWSAIPAPGVGSPGGSTGGIQFNNAGAFAADSSNFFWDDTNDRLGIGTSSPAERLHVAGNILIGARPDVSPTWTLRSNSTAGTITSGGTSAIGTTTAMAVYNGSLYIGTSKTNAAEIYRYDGSNWTRVSSTTAGYIGTTTVGNIDTIASMMVWNGQLYVGTRETGAAEVYRYNGNSNWTRISSSTAGAIGGNGTTTAIDSISAMTVHGGMMYIGTTKSNGAEVYRYNGPGFSHLQSWTKVSNIPGNLGTIGATASVDAVNVLFSFQGWLYAGTSEAGSSAAIYRYDGQSTTGTGFTIIGTAGTFSGTSATGASTITAVGSITTAAVFNGRVYLGIDDGAGTARVVKWDGNANAGTAYQLISSTTAGIIAEDVGAQTGIDKIGAMSVYNGGLYVGTVDSTGISQVYKLDDANTWSVYSSTTAGAISTTPGATSAITGVFSMAVYNDDLWVGTEKASASEVYSLNLAEGQSYNLGFEASSDNAESIQNGLANRGWIQFRAEESPQNNTGNVSTGKFMFSNGISTVGGAYDLAEDYPTHDDTLAPGDLVSLDTREKGFVRKAQGRNDRDIIGIYSVDPALRLSQKDSHIDGARAVPVALAGRVPVSVTLENGPIKIGDYLTSAIEPGKAAKATKPGRVIGRALGTYSGIEGEDPKVTVFIGVESIGWNDIASVSDDVSDLVGSTALTNQNAIIEFVDTVNESVEDIVFAVLNKAENVSLIITNKFTALVASIQELFVKTLTILPGGSISVPSGTNQIAGTGMFSPGQMEVFVENDQVDANTVIYVTPTSEAESPIYVAGKSPGKGFVVKTKTSSAQGISFDWFFIKTYVPKSKDRVTEVITQVQDQGSATTTTTILSPESNNITSNGQPDATVTETVSSQPIEGSGITDDSDAGAREEGGQIKSGSENVNTKANTQSTVTSEGLAPTNNNSEPVSASQQQEVQADSVVESSVIPPTAEAAPVSAPIEAAPATPAE